MFEDSIEHLVKKIVSLSTLRRKICHKIRKVYLYFLMRKVSWVYTQRFAYIFDASSHSSTPMQYTPRVSFFYTFKHIQTVAKVGPRARSRSRRIWVAWAVKHDFAHYRVVCSKLPTFLSNTRPSCKRKRKRKHQFRQSLMTLWSCFSVFRHYWQSLLVSQCLISVNMLMSYAELG